MRHRALDVILVLGALLSPLLYFQDRGRFIVEFIPTWYAPLDAHLGPWFEAAMAATGLATIFGLIVALHVVWRKRRASDVARAKAYLYAFGIRDGALFFVAVVAPILVGLPPSGRWTDLIYIMGPALSTLVWIPIAAYGILRSQLFDIDVRIKLTLERSTLVAIFAGLAFLVSELLEGLFVGRLANGQFAVALLVAGGCAFAFRRIPQRLADLMMPHAGDAARLESRRHEVYRSACEGAMLDGELDVREVAVLERLRLNLGLSVEEAERIARESTTDP